MQLLSYMKKYNIPSRAMPDVRAEQIWARDILQTNDCTAKTAYSWINWNLVKSTLKGSTVDESKFIRLLWTCSRFGLSPFWLVAVLTCRRFDLSPFWTVAVLTIPLTITTETTQSGERGSAVAPKRIWKSVCGGGHRSEAKVGAFFGLAPPLFWL